MEINKVKAAIAGMLGTLKQIDPLTGLPYDPYSDLYGATVRANAEAPMSLADTDLPTWCIFAARATYPTPPDQSVNRLQSETRDFTCNLYVCLAQTGIDGEAERKVEPYLDAARNLIQGHPLFYDGNIADIVPGIMRAYLVSDDGIVTLTYGQSRYNGLRFTIRVDGKNLVTYGNE